LFSFTIQVNRVVPTERLVVVEEKVKIGDTRAQSLHDNADSFELKYRVRLNAPTTNVLTVNHDIPHSGNQEDV